ncbi:hypothetical protein ElyMa_001929500 [Elysia marginata]|uniref:Uncharacterized protein n=1 Tax=Elysia marginata TaxID=1093978 RepID=A0AAV4EVF1_9GAST|nr:hypothetical protein ElyMa_001929500 [Elysia marginata]
MSGLRVQRAYYGSEHGKGEADGETGVLSQAMEIYVKGTRKMHQIERVNDFIIKSRCLACFCCACRQDNTSLCINKLYVGDFITHKLRQSKTPPDDAFLEPPEEEPLGDQTFDAGAGMKVQSRWAHMCAGHTLSAKGFYPYNALVLEVFSAERHIYVSCLRSKVAASSQPGEVWYFQRCQTSPS